MRKESVEPIDAPTKTAREERRRPRKRPKALPRAAETPRVRTEPGTKSTVAIM